jgi:outer membrane protein TolC
MGTSMSIGKMRRLLILILAALSYGADASLQKYIDIALQNNPALQAAQKNYEAAEKKIAGVGTLEYPKLDIGIGPDASSASLMQMFNWPGTQSAFQGETKAMAKMQAARLRKAKDSLVAAVKIGWHNLCFINLKIKYMQENLELMKQMENLAKAEFTAGKGLAELLTIQEEILEMDYEIDAMKLEFSAMAAAFNAMLNAPEPTEIKLTDSITMQKPDSERDFEPPMISMIHAEGENFRAMQEMNKAMGRPMFGLGVQYENQMGNNMVMAMASITLPIWRAKTNAALLETQLLSEASQRMLLDAKNNLNAERTMAKNNLQNLEKKVMLYKKQRELAESSQKIAMQSFASGQSMLPDLLQINRKLLGNRIKEIEAIIEYNKAAAEAEVLF